MATRDKKKKVRVFMRAGGAVEVCIGTVTSVAELPELLESIAQHLRAGLAPDELETPRVPGG